MTLSVKASELHDELRGLSSSDTMERLFSFARCPKGGFRKNLEGKWFAVGSDIAGRFEPQYAGPFLSKDDAEKHVFC